MNNNAETAFLVVGDLVAFGLVVKAGAELTKWVAAKIEARRPQPALFSPELVALQNENDHAFADLAKRVDAVSAPPAPN